MMLSENIAFVVRGELSAYLVECRRAFILEDLGSTIQSAGVSRSRLKADFDNIWQLSFNMNGSELRIEGKLYQTAVL